MSEVLQELQDVRDEASATKEQLHSYKESCGRLQEELQVCDCLSAFILLLRVFSKFGGTDEYGLFFSGKKCYNRGTTGPTSKGRNKKLQQLTFFVNTLLSSNI